jgi:hypothetical protein
MMISPLPRRLKVIVYLVACYQIIGGVAGILQIAVVTSVLIFAAPTSLATLIFVVATILNSFSVYCGILLLRGRYLKGFKLSIINQAIQSISFVMLGYSYNFIAGVVLLAGLKVAGTVTPYLNFSWRPTWRITTTEDGKPLDIALNLVAVAFIITMVILRRRIKKNLPASV